MVGAHCLSLVTLSKTSAHLIIIMWVKLIGDMRSETPFQFNTHTHTHRMCRLTSGSTLLTVNAHDLLLELSLPKVISKTSQQDM